MITISVEETRETVQDFMQEYGYSFEVLLDERGSVSFQYMVRSHPTKFLIDPKGKIVGWARGYRQWDTKAMRMLINTVSTGEPASDKEASLAN